MTASCVDQGGGSHPGKHTVTIRNNPGKGGDRAAFWQALHRRVCDRMAWPWARAWLATYSRLEPSTAAGWPVFRLVLLADPPPSITATVLHQHYRNALAAGCKSGPLADLAGSLELAE
jgi:hypothetical protein